MALILILVAIVLTIYVHNLYASSGIDKNEFERIKLNNKKETYNKIINIFFIILTILLCISLAATVCYFIFYGGMTFVTFGAFSYYRSDLGDIMSDLARYSTILFNIWIYFLPIKIIINKITLMIRLNEKIQSMSDDGNANKDVQ